jgi:hypothetical protein
MKTTIELADPLLRRAKRAAARRGTTLRAVIEEALRRALDQEERAETPPEIRTHVFGGRGLQAGIDWGDWDGIRARAYEGRGG